MRRKLRLVASGDTPECLEASSVDAAKAFESWRSVSKTASRAASAAARLASQELADASLEAAVAAETIAERSLFSAPSRNLADLAAKIWVAAGQDFESNELNDGLRREAAQILRAAGMVGPEAGRARSSEA